MDNFIKKSLIFPSILRTPRSQKRLQALNNNIQGDSAIKIVATESRKIAASFYFTSRYFPLEWNIALYTTKYLYAWSTTMNVPSSASECVSPFRNQRGRGHTRLRVRGWKGSNSDDWRKSLVHCLLCEWYYSIATYRLKRKKGSLQFFVTRSVVDGVNLI